MTDKSAIQNARILIVDDNVANIALLQNILQRVGYQAIKSLTDPQQTFSAVESFCPDLIILDLNMPKLDGFQVMEVLRTMIPKETHLPILVLTADTNPQTKRKALLAGATDFCSKPFDSSELFLRLHNLIARRLLHMELLNHNQRLEEVVAERTRELANALEEVKSAQRQMMQQERLRAFGEMASGVAHDFNNALMSIIGYSDLLLGDEALLSDREVLEEYLRTINTAGRDASHVVGRLREFYRPREEGESFESVDLNKLITEIVRITQPKWRDQALSTGRRIQVETDLAQVPVISGNPAELREVLTNLIFNACDAMPRGGTITLATERRGDTAIVEVRDTGTGMTEEVRARCIEPFFTTKGEQGTGLGLAQVFGVIGRHGGEIEIESEPDRGTTMRLRIPAQSNNPLPSPKANVPGVATPPLRVLVVDDEPRVRDIVTKYLESDGHAVTTAANGSEAIREFMEGSFDLLVSDQAMPGMTGEQLANVIGQLSNSRPVILLSGFAESDHPMPPAVKAFVSKPVSHPELRAALAKALN
jgi:signal transduction histidine kinase